MAPPTTAESAASERQAPKCPRTSTLIVTVIAVVRLAHPAGAPRRQSRCPQSRLQRRLSTVPVDNLSKTPQVLRTMLRRRNHGRLPVRQRIPHLGGQRWRTPHPRETTPAATRWAGWRAPRVTLRARTPWPAPPPVLTCCEHPPEAWRHGLWGVVVPEIPRKFDPEFREGAVRIVRETKKPIAVIARELGRQPGHAGELGQEGQGGAG